jgi:hypothetical protein
MAGSNSAEGQDEISLSVISFLERHAGIADVECLERPAVSARGLQDWERANYPCVLPEDLKSFLRLRDGLLLKWSVRIDGVVMPLGRMQVNDLANLKPCPREVYQGKPCAGNPGRLGDQEAASECVAGFELDSSALDGRVALLYRGGGKHTTSHMSSGTWLTRAF